MCIDVEGRCGENKIHCINIKQNDTIHVGDLNLGGNKIEFSVWVGEGIWRCPRKA